MRETHIYIKKQKKRKIYSESRSLSLKQIILETKIINRCIKNIVVINIRKVPRGSLIRPKICKNKIKYIYKIKITQER